MYLWTNTPITTISELSTASSRIVTPMTEAFGAMKFGKDLVTALQVKATALKRLTVAREMPMELPTQDSKLCGILCGN